jgi:hypothetical protein
VAAAGTARTGFTIDADPDGTVLVTEDGQITQRLQPRKGHQ